MSMYLKICEFNLAVSVSMDLKFDVFNIADIGGSQGWRVQIWMISMYSKCKKTLLMSMDLKICEFNHTVSVSMDLKFEVFNMADIDGSQGW